MEQFSLFSYKLESAGMLCSSGGKKKKHLQNLFITTEKTRAEQMEQNAAHQIGLDEHCDVKAG